MGGRNACGMPCIGLIIIDVHVYSKTSISINKYMQNAGEPKNDAGFRKVIIIAVHVAQLP